jgi:hypothetical protein
VIRFAGTLDLRLYRRSFWLALGGTALPWVLISMSAMLLAAGLVLLGLRQVLMGVVYAGAGLLGAWSVANQEVAIRRSWKTYRLARDPAEGWLDDDAFHARSEYGESNVPWDRFHQVKASATLLLLYPSATIYLILGEEHFASPEDWQAAKALVRQKVPAAPRMKLSRIIWVLLGATVFLFGLLFVWAWWESR